MESDFRLGTARAMPITVRSLREVWIASRHGWIERSDNWSRMENDDIASEDSSVERLRERVLRRGTRESIRRRASEQVACVTTALTG
jgi:hypothetical protein